jgi:hypothetical protein
MRVKREYSTYSKANYERFIAENKLTKEEIPFDKYVKNLKVCNWLFIEYAIRTGKKAQLPFGFGNIAVNKKKLKRYKEFNGKTYINLQIDWAKTKQYGKRIYHTNEHTDGYNYKWMWFPKEAKLHLSHLYVFKATRNASRVLSKYLKRPNSIYKDLYLEWAKLM